MTEKPKIDHQTRRCNMDRMAGNGLSLSIEKKEGKKVGDQAFTRPWDLSDGSREQEMLVHP